MEVLEWITAALLVFVSALRALTFEPVTDSRSSRPPPMWTATEAPIPRCRHTRCRHTTLSPHHTVATPHCRHTTLPLDLTQPGE